MAVSVPLHTLQIVSNAVRVVSTSITTYERYVGATLPAAQWCSCVVSTATASNSAPGLALRLQPTLRSGYLLTSGFGVTDIRRIIDNAETTLASAATAVASGQTLEFEADGPNLYGYVNGTLVVTATDATYATGDSGLAVYSQGVTATIVDTWACGDFDPGYPTRRTLASDAFTRADNTDLGADWTPYSILVDDPILPQDALDPHEVTTSNLHGPGITWSSDRRLNPAGPRTGTVLTATTSAEFATALTNAQYGDDIVLDAGTTFSAAGGQGFVIPADSTKAITASTPRMPPAPMRQWSATQGLTYPAPAPVAVSPAAMLAHTAMASVPPQGWPSYIRIMSSGWAALPTGAPTAAGRAHPSDTANMPTIQMSGSANQPLLRTTPQSEVINACHHYRFEGVYFLSSDGASTQIGMIFLGGVNTSPETSTWQAPHHMVFDRCVSNGAKDGTNSAGPRWIYIRGCRYFADLAGYHYNHWQDQGSQESHAVLMLNPGPAHFKGVYSEGFTEGLAMIYSGSNYTEPKTPCDIIIEQCHCRTLRRDIHHATRQPGNTYPGTVEVSHTILGGSGTVFTDGQGGVADLSGGNYFAVLGQPLMEVASRSSNTSAVLVSDYGDFPPGQAYLVIRGVRVIADSPATSTAITVTVSGTTLTRSSGTWRAGDPFNPGPQAAMYFARTQWGTTAVLTALSSVGTTTAVLAAAPQGGDGAVTDWYITPFSGGLTRGAKKNLLEFKSGHRIHVRGCVFDTNIPDGVEGYAVVTNSNSHTTSFGVREVTIENCLMRNTRGGFSVQNVTSTAHTHLYRNCLAVTYWTGGGRYNNLFPAVCTFDHCSIINWSDTDFSKLTGITLGNIGGGGSWSGLVRNNIIAAMAYVEGAGVSDQVQPYTGAGLTINGNLTTAGVPNTAAARGAAVARNVFFGGTVAAVNSAGSGREITAPIFQGVGTFGAQLGANVGTNVAVPDHTQMGFTNWTGDWTGNYRIVPIQTTVAAAVTVSGSVVTVAGDTFSTAIVMGTPFRVSGDGTDKLTCVNTRTSATQVDLLASYPGTTGAGLTGLFGFGGYATDGTDPGCDIDALEAAIAGVAEPAEFAGSV